MALPLADAADVLRSAGLTVVELPGWKSRGETDGSFFPLGVMLHHDGMGLGFDNDPSNDDNVPEYMSQNGSDGSQFWVRRDGVWFCLAAGRKWHAGTGSGWGKIPANSGNSCCAAIETDHTPGNPWTAEQAASILTGSRALAQHYNWDVDRYCCGHREYAPGRKADPENYDLDAWRAAMKTSPTPCPITVPVQAQVLTPTLSIPTNLLEFILSLPGAPATYAQLIKDIVNEISKLNARSATNLGVLNHLPSFAAIAGNNANNGLNWDGSAKGK